MSGGHTPARMLELLDPEPLAVAGTEIFQVDERVAPDGDPARNLTAIRAALPAGLLGRVRAMPVLAEDLEAAARDYATRLPERLDMVHLGLGADGHTASLVPGDPVLEVDDRPVALTAGAYQGRRRMTLTYPALDGARRVLWLVTGAGKSQALARLMAGDPEIPAGRVRASRAVVVCDAEAAGSLG